MDIQRCFSLQVLAVLLLIAFDYYTVLFCVVQPWLSFVSASGVLHTIMFTVLAMMILVSFGLAILRDPGQVPSNYLPDLETFQTSVPKGKFCDKCAQYKPARAHHCKICKRCILRMDHHCVWTNNCVGHKNYKAFFLFVLYVTLGSAYSLVLLGRYALDGKVTTETNNHLKTMRVVCTMIMAPLSMVLSALLAWHVYLLFHNKTTIEYYQGKRERWLAEKAGQVYRHPYDLGLLANIVTVLGPKINYWLCPMSVGHIGSGLWSRTLSENISCNS